MMRKGSPPLPEAGEGRRGEDGYLGYLLRQAASAYRNLVERTLADLGVTPPQFAALTMLNTYPGLSGADLARLTFVTPQTASVVLANLERGGSITRRADEVHGRIQRTEVTERGRALLEACRLRVHALEEDLSQGLTGAEDDLVRRWLVRIGTMRPHSRTRAVAGEAQDPSRITAPRRGSP